MMAAVDDRILADQIRSVAFETHVQPAEQHAELRIRAGDVHKQMGFAQRVPLVVASLRARQFREQYGLELLRIEGRPVGASTTFVFRRAVAGETAADEAAGKATWAEITSLEHGHGGPGWELGRWLWSPTTSKDGAQRYAVMEQPLPGDQVFHLVSGVIRGEPKQRVLFGVSRVAVPARQTSAKPPLPGVWGDADSYFRIRLEGFRELASKVRMEDVEADLAEEILADLADRPKYYPYAPYKQGFRGSQGIYLSKLTESLAEALRTLAGAAYGPFTPIAHAERIALREYAEGQRAKREASFFKRNPQLRADAISKHGVHCKACGKSFGELYGALGEGFVEIHHLNPLAERVDALRAEPSMTTVDDVVPLCANCHRMVHRRRPALSLNEIRLAISAAAAD